MAAAPEAARWTLTLVGPPRVQGPAGTFPLEGRAAALLAHVASTGGSARTLLATWLWPESPGGAGRANLRQLLRRLRLSLGAELLTGGETLHLRPEVEVDLLALRTLAFAGRHPQVLDARGELLEGLRLDELPDFEEWLASEREGLHQLRRHAALQEARGREAAGDLPGALHHARLGVGLEPLSEDAWRLLMRLHHRQGDRAAALAAYKQCARHLHEELGVAPLPETRELAAEIGRGGSLPGTAPAPRPELPLGIQHPPRLVGREALWARMKAAWAGGQGIILTGAPGVGKTRLALDFLEAHGGGMRFEGRPGDAGLLYATHARTFRQVLDAYPDPDLAPWVRGELSRLLPDLGASPGPLASEAQKLRFWQAKVEVLGGAIRRGLRRMVFDDVQFMDEASVEAGGFVFTQLGWGRPEAPYRTVHIFREGALSPFQTAALEGLVGAGLVSLIEVLPLGEAAVGAWLGELDLPLPPAGLAADLTRYTGGNALFVAETLRHLFESGLIARGLPARLPPPGRVRQVLDHRLAHLSRPALHAARAAAVLQSDFHPELVAGVLGAPLLAVLDAWEELERAQVVQGRRFHHDLILEAVDAGIPDAVRQTLHRAAARALGEAGGCTARVARHWLSGGEPGRAAPLFLAAARGAGDLLRFTEALTLYEAAAAAFEAAGNPEAAFEARAAVFERLWLHDLGAALDPLVERLLAGARTPPQQARACAAQAVTLLVAHRQDQAAEQAAGRGLAALPADGGGEVRAELLRLIVEARLMRGDRDGVGAAIAQAEEALTAEGKSAALLRLSVGAARWRLWRDERAAGELEQAAGALAALGDGYGAAYARSLAAQVLEARGQHERAATLRRDIGGRLGEAGLPGKVHYDNLVRLAANLTGQHRYGMALEKLEEARTLHRENGRLAGVVARAESDLYWVLGEWEGCLAAADRALHDPDPGDPAWGTAWIRRGQACARLGREDEAREAFGRAGEFLRAAPDAYALGLLKLCRAEGLPPDEARPLREEALALARKYGHANLHTAALSALAQGLLEGGQPDGALALSREAAARWETALPREDPLRPLLVHHRVLAALGDPEARCPLETALAWLNARLREDVPVQHAAAFLAQPTHAALRALVPGPVLSTP